jgi:hypothetical protein
MSAPSEQMSFPLSMSSAADFPAKTSLAQAAARALLERARVCGVSSLVLPKHFCPSGSSSKTLLPARRDGSTKSCVSWTDSAMSAYLFLCRRAMSELFTCVEGSSLLPTATVNGNYNRKGMSKNSGDGLVTALRAPYPTLCRRDEKGPSPNHTKAGADLPQVICGHLNPQWTLWFMGFPEDWLDVNDDA